ncbi:mucin-5AC [Oncorhynchus kisutch]|uniref:mucin-5AC n=1 Tax=Oncorhynchus kisutch TaxID=8019 RepID=UPI0012DE01D6|nr:mucin-5AC-like [Oncorhynchus kisutch]
MSLAIGLTASQSEDTSKATVNIIPSMSRIPEIAGVSPIHNGQVCSTWGNYHFKTFDGDIFQLPSTCNYVVTSLCHSSYEDFNIQMRRQVVDNQPTISKITMKLDGTVVELSKGSIVVNGNNATLPFSQSGILIEETPSYIKIKAKLGLVAIWNQDDSLLVEMDIKFRNKTCGLCGDFNAIQQFDEFYSHGMKLSPVDFGNFWKLDGPTESCTENTLPSNQKCPNLKPVCEQLLSGPAFSSCKDLLAIDSFVEACVSDLCHCDNSTNSFCLCNTISEYSRQCVHAGGKPKQWRTEQFCYKTCPFNMEYQECGNPCVDTCSNPERGQLCEEHCSDGCFCPPGTVFDDVNKNGCIALSQCSCRHNGKTYAPGETYSRTCKDCSCAGGQWNCVDKDCPGTCAVEGGSHINTYDGKTYTFHGDCSYVLTKDCDGMQFTVLGDLVQCGLSDSETCLKAVTLSLSEGATVINIQPNGKAFVNGIYSQLPFSAAGVTIFRASSFFIIVQTTFGLQLEIQLSPIMQVYIAASTVWQQRTCGLCGNFNNNQGDDFKVLSGVTEGTAIGFANTWKTRASCPDIKSSFESPCSLSLDNEKYAQHWCSQLADPKGLFAKCHTAISPDIYKENCMYDSCNCEKSEDCMCAAVSSYVHACAAEGIQLSGWRDTICNKYSTSCPSTMVYSYSIKSSDRSCRCYSDSDFTCSITFEPVDGCVCSEGSYLDDEGKCVPPASCPCYYKGSVVSPGEVISKDGTMCTCKEGKLRCIGDSPDQPSCVAPMVFFNCSNASPGVRGLECQKSCNILDMACISTECISGCMCPSGLVSDGKGGCIKPDLCPCSHNGATYQPGDRIKVDCNTCTCKDRKWQCTTNLCLGTCAIYGDGHYITFDGKRFTFEGDCEYTLTKDYCGSNNANGSFRVITENIPCGTTGTTCSKAIKLFLGNNELILTEGNYQVVERNTGEAVPYQIRTMGIYLVIEANNGLILMWDRKTSMFIKLNPQFKGHVCGLCGNYDGNANNDFTTRSQAVVVNPLDFGNSWKVSASCPDAKNKRSPCTANPYRQSWSQKQCSIIQSKVFTDCHSKVDPSPFYDACVTDSCACDSGGDCECFCTAVAAYAEACNEAGACIAWRSPQICPLFCDYYNPPGECEWHYKACGAQCMKTCRNPSGSCSTQIPPLEGCYPKCPPAQPFFDEDIMKCVEKEQCGCYGRDRKHYNNGEKVPTTENCQTCYCNSVTVDCKYDVQACTCTYNGNKYPNGHIIYNTTNGHGSCITAICGKNGTTQRDIYPCSTPTPTLTPSVPNSTPSSTVTTTVFTFSTPTTAPTTTSTETTVSPTTFTTTCGYPCVWSQWFDTTFPTLGTPGGDSETYNNIRAEGHDICEKPSKIQCRAEKYPNVSISQVGQVVQCNVAEGLTCRNEDQSGPFPLCFNYQVRVLCCDEDLCTSKPTTISPTTTRPPVTTTTTNAITFTISTTTLNTKPPNCTVCEWSPWYNVDYPQFGPGGGDNESIKKILESGKHICEKPVDVKCQAVRYPGIPLSELRQNVECNTKVGLICQNKDQGIPPICLDYEIKVKCCKTVKCHTTTPVQTTKPTVTTTTMSASTLPTTTSKPTTITTPPTSTLPLTTTTTPTTTPTPRTTILTSTAPPTTLTTVTPITTPTPTTKTSTAPPTTKTTTQTPSPSTTPTTTPTSTSTGVTPTQCSGKETCVWSDWINLGQPTSGSEGGDNESIKNIIAAGYHICSAPEAVECRAKQFPGIQISQLGQDVTCNPSVGLVCQNNEQGLQQKCFDYEIRVKCCQCGTTTHIPTTATTTVPHITTPTPTTTTSTSTAPPTTKTTTQTPSPSTTPTTTPTSTSTGVTPTQCSGKETCVWSDWINLGQPTSGSEGGDNESIKNIIAAGYHICSAPEAVECRAKQFPGIQISQLGQDVTCNPSVGLVCQNNEQGLQQKCFDYEIRVKCCQCGTTTHIPTTATTTVPHITTPTPTTTTSTSTAPPTTKTTTQTPSPSTTPTTTPTSTSTGVTPTQCSGKETCVWSDWINLGQPTSGSEGGDNESIKNIIAAGYHICSAPEAVECRAKQFPGIQISQLGQDVTCNPSVGLVCQNNEQGLQQKCFDYEIRVKCCQCGTTTHIPTTATTTVPHITTPTPTTTTSTSTAPPTTKTTTQTPSPSTTPTTTPTSTSTGVTPTQCSGKETCVWSDWINLGQPTSGSEGGDNESIKNIIAAGYHICSAPEAVECRAKQFPGLQISQLGQDVTCNPSVGLVCQNNEQGLQQKCFDYEIRVKCCQCGTTTHIPPTATTTVPHITTPTPTTTTSTSTAPPTTKTTTQTPSPSTTPTTTPTSTSTGVTPTQCSGKETCVWSDWINLGQPTSGSEGGDNESIKNIIAAGYHICSAPEAVECRAKQFPGIQISQLGQDVTCNPSVGLVCQNNEQGLQQKCFDYEIRVKCCQCGTTTHIPTTATTTVPHITTPTPTTTTSTSTAPPTTKTTTQTPSPSTTPTTTPTSTSTGVTPTQCSGKETCVWSDWINLGQPTSGSEGGDNESIKNIIAAGYHICSAPEAVECRAKQFPGIQISQLGQDVTCNPSVGLVCQNNEQGLQQKCFDYEIRVKCCQCGTTTHIPTTATTTVPHITTPTPTTTTSTSTAPPTTKTTTQTPSPSTTPTTTPTSTSTGVTPTQCSGKETCVWSDWINLGQPTSGSEGGDNESIKNIIAAGYHICSAPEAVECRAKQFPGIQISQLGQDVTCNPSVGLVCQNNEQGLQQKCFDYEIRVKCCQCGTTTHIPTTATTTVPHITTPTPTTTTSTSTAPPTTKTTTQTPSPSTTPTTTPTSTSTGVTPTQCSGKETCVWSDWINLGQPTSGSEGGDNESIKNIIAAGYHICSAPEAVECRAKQFPGIQISQLGQDVTCNPSVGLVCQNNEQGLQQKCFDYEIRVKCCQCGTTTHIPTTATTTVPHITTPTPTTTTSTSTAPPTTKTTTQTPSPSTTPTTTPTSTSTGVTPTQCSGKETCVWSDWINLGQPTSGSEGGDNESIKNIIAAGYHICSAPEAVECRAKQFPGLQISQLGQDVTCNPSVGLVCQNNEQGLQQKCFDYEIRVKCCQCGTTTHIPPTATTTVPHITTPTPTTTTSTSTAPPTTKTTTQTPSPSTTPTTTPTSTSTGVTPTQCSGKETCVWSDWINLGQPTSGSEGGDNESIKNIIAAGYHICSAPEAVECRAKQFPGIQISQLGQDVTCNPSVGLVCQNNEQGLQQKCFDYEIRVKCCQCGTTTHIPTTATTTVPHITTPTPTTTTSTSTAPPTTKTTTQTPSPSTTPTTTPTSTSTGVTPTQCSGKETCVWSDWINLGQPTSGSEGGDNESIKNIIAAGYHICSAPEAVECRAKQFPGLQISQLGQDVTCNPSVGLVCQNNEQGLQQKCFDYEIRVKCCQCGTTTHIPPTATTTVPHITTPTPTTTTSTSTAPPTTKTTTQTPSPSTTPITTPTSTLTGVTPTQCSGKETCVWSDWINLGQPTSGSEGGDNESIKNIIAAGYHICSAPEAVECRAKQFPGIQISQLGQDVTCNPSVGLVCQNNEQGLQQKCFDYEIRVKCCQCGTTTHIPTTATTTVPHITTPTPTTTTSTSTAPPTTKTTTQTPSPSTTPTTTPTSTSTGVTPTQCSGKETCVWSDWINLGQPTSGSEGGDNESIKNIIAAGYHICSAPEAVECRAKQFPGLQISQLGQDVTCNPSVGLVCQNNEQGLQQKCFDYEIRVKCCQCGTTTHIPPTATTTVPHITTPTPTTTTSTSTAPPTTKTTTQTPSPSTTPTTTPTSTSTGVTPTQCSGKETCVWSDWINLGQPTSGSEGGDNESIKNIIAAGYHICSAPEAVECRAKQFPGIQISQLGQDVTCNPSVGLVCQNNEQGLQQKCFDYEIRVKCCQCGTTTHIPTTATTTVPHITTPTPTTTTSTSTAPPTTKTTTQTPSPSTTPTTTPTSTSTGVTPTQCSGKETCVWSDWINLGQPTSGSEGGDNESIKNIIAAGYHICSAPEAVECRAKQFPGIQISQLGQDVTCNPSVGLVCQNNEQGLQQKCFDYEIRVKCCQCGTTTHIPPTATTTVPHITTPTPTTTTSTSTAPPTTKTTTQTPSPSTTPTTTPTSTSTGVTPTQCSGKETCVWSDWINLGQPTSGSEGGDNESIKNIIAAGYHICSAPEAVECRAKQFPGIQISQLGQDVTCNPSVGLVCQNNEQGLQQKCFDYEIRVKCCQCGTTTHIPTTATTTVPHITTPTPTTTTSTSTAPPTTKTTTQTPSPSTTPTTTPTSTSTGVTPTQCSGKETCVWSDWINLGQPTSGSEGGDNESIKNIIAAGYHICSAPEAVECRAKQFPGIQISQLGQDVTCNPSVGLVCQNNEQGLQQKCFDYEIRVKCCQCGTTTHIPTTATTTVPHITTPTPTTTTSTSTAPPTTKTTTQTPSPSTTPTTTPTSTSTGVTPTQCSGKETCVWSDWINLGQPTSGSEGGDNESIKNIIAAGYHICSAPEAVECRAKQFPGIQISQLGQDVTCNPSVGLVCQNNEQGLQQKCFDYEIRVKCCQCGTTTHIPTTATTTVPHITTPTPTTTTSTSTAPPTTKTTTLPPTTTIIPTTPFFVITGETAKPSIPVTLPHYCSFCHFNHTDFLIGSIVYNVSDHDGWCYIGLCNKTCEIETHLTSCGTSTTPVTPTSPTTSQPPTTTVPHVTYPSEKNCDHDHPPRQNGDRWIHNQCTNGTCANGKVSYEHVHCETPKPISCENNYPPIQVFDESGCCFHYECQCICYGWGDPHYVTFDGTYYGFQGNCSYVLVKEILPKYNFSVVIDNYYCDAPDGLSCPQSLTIYYQSYKIFMTKKDVDGVFTSLIYVNQKRIIPAYDTKDFRITDNGIETLLVIPAINAKVSFTGLMFSIYLPWDKFSGNTEGQCGTCDNNRTDDCRLPNGTIDSSCPDMAHQWHVADHNNSQCTPPPTPEPIPTPPRGCDPPICHLIQSKVFESCHKIIPYEPFLVACIFDACYMDDVTIGCTSLQTYADVCAQAGVCIEWRNYTNGQCDFTCEKPKVYKACGPQVEPTCNAWYNFKFIQTQNEFSVMGDIQLEGCYCPPGTTLMSSSSNYCIPSCDICPLPNGEWKEANETWVSNCQECVCDPYSLEIQCQPMACQHQPPLTCDQEGQVKVVETVDCCQKDKCECDVTRCSTSKITCPVGFETEATMGVCCLTYQCVPTDVCVFNNTEYQPGANVPGDKCKNCVCGDSVDAQSHLHIIECHPTECDTHCQQGYDHQAVPGQCCGKCVQTSCVVMLPDNTTHTIQPGSVWIPSGDKCLKYECVKIQDQLIPIEAKTVCPVFHPEDCIPGTEVIAPDGCCHVCIPITKPCNVTKSKVYLDSNGCKSANKVEVTTCSGSCVTYAMYSLEANMMERSCTCCREESTIKKEVEMICPDGSKFNHPYIHINKCGCQRTECVTLEETQVTRSRRRRR